MRLYVVDASVHIRVPQCDAARKHFAYYVKALKLHFFHSLPKIMQ